MVDYLWQAGVCAAGAPGAALAAPAGPRAGILLGSAPVQALPAARVLTPAPDVRILADRCPG